MADVKIGVVTHYFDKIGVAVMKLEDGELTEGEKIKVVGRGNEFTQVIVSMQAEHQPIKKAKKGDEFGIKMDQPVKEGDEVFKVS